MSRNNFPDPSAGARGLFGLIGVAIAVFTAGVFAGIALQYLLGC